MINTRHIHIARVKIDNISFAGAIEEIEKAIDKDKRLFVTTPNVDHIVNLQRDRYFRKVYQSADLVLPDGMPLIWASKFLGIPLGERIPGSDLFLELCRISSMKGYKLFLLGGRPGAAVTARTVLEKKYPQINIVGSYCPYYGFEHDEAENQKIVKMIKDSGADILFVGLGSPKQEKWIYEHKDLYDCAISIGIGVSFEFTAEMVKRAPIWMQRIGLEWLWRLLMEPKSQQ